MALKLLTLMFLIPLTGTVYRTCIPNSQFQLNGLVCQCNHLGQWNEHSCTSISKQSEKCRPGLVIWHDCNQCICQENGLMACTNTDCGDKPKRGNEILDLKKLQCVPFASYFINCSLCVCPASGRITEARCAYDARCAFGGTSEYLDVVRNNVCIPKVIYIFPCLQCLCANDGFFAAHKCVDTCSFVHDTVIRCTPMTFYKKNCNFCLCPESGIVNEQLCTNRSCSRRAKLDYLNTILNETRACERHSFTSPRCIYCDCSQHGVVNDKTCLESDCMVTRKIKKITEISTCSPNEAIVTCQECFCLRDGRTDPKYCSKTCSQKEKISLLESVVRDSFHDNLVMDRKLVKKPKGRVCEPRSVYKHDGGFCLCPEDGNKDLKLCVHDLISQSANKFSLDVRSPPKFNIDFNVTCSPNTFVEFDCNTCYCFKNGKINPKWCTYDNCEAKKKIMDVDKRHTLYNLPDRDYCTPGSISKIDCNYCICPKSGLLKERLCTKIPCTELRNKANKANEGFICEPLSYYMVDCNVCHCPKNGVKNVAQCTRNGCDKSPLRSNICVPGRLFCDDCNVCVCPPNGDKNGRICSNNTCSDLDTPWKKLFKLSHSLLSYPAIADSTRKLELCFPGEEFEVGCKVCSCPDLGLRAYASCSHQLCTDETGTKEPDVDLELMATNPARRLSQSKLNDPRCADYNISGPPERQQCTPGSMYIIRCRQCICPYMGSLNHFCRPLPGDYQCEEAYPGVHYQPMGRRAEENETLIAQDSPALDPNVYHHNHTVVGCSTPGQVSDPCFICNCTNEVLIMEHCFQNEDPTCQGKIPTFIGDIKTGY